MSTKVKGEAIKEGSIPLSALDDAISEAIPYISYGEEPVVINIKKGVTEYNLSRFLNFGTYFKFNNTIHPKENKSNFNTNLHGPSITGGFTNREATYLILNSAPIADQTVLLYPKVSYNKIKKEFLPDIGGADWNAQEGEAGYIENKPFKFIDKHENAFFYDAEYNPNYIIWDAHGAFFSSAIQILDFDGNPKYIDLTNHANGIFDNMDNIFNSSSLSYEWIDGKLGIKIPQWILDSDEDIQDYVDELLRYSTGGELVKINNGYLPDTVLKTTPQTLSDTDKNQVLANLGIDPVVWKYMCNPHIIDYDIDADSFSNPIPKELSDIIYQNGTLNHFVLSTVLIQTHDSDGVSRGVERITLYNKNGSIIFNENEFYYDPNTRLFTV